MEETLHDNVPRHRPAYTLRARSPCNGCTERWVTDTTRCHATCERYARFVAQKNAESAARIAAADAENDVDAVLCRKRHKYRREE